MKDLLAPILYLIGSLFFIAGSIVLILRILKKL